MERPACLDAIVARVNAEISMRDDDCGSDHSDPEEGDGDGRRDDRYSRYNDRQSRYNDRYSGRSEDQDDSRSDERYGDPSLEDELLDAQVALCSTALS